MLFKRKQPLGNKLAEGIALKKRHFFREKLLSLTPSKWTVKFALGVFLTLFALGQSNSYSQELPKQTTTFEGRETKADSIKVSFNPFEKGYVHVYSKLERDGISAYMDEPDFEKNANIILDVFSRVNELLPDSGRTTSIVVSRKLTTMYFPDERMATFNPQVFKDSLMTSLAALHEAAHSVYRQKNPEAIRQTMFLFWERSLYVPFLSSYGLKTANDLNGSIEGRIQVGFLHPLFHLLKESNYWDYQLDSTRPSSVWGDPSFSPSELFASTSVVIACACPNTMSMGGEGRFFDRLFDLSVKDPHLALFLTRGIATILNYWGDKERKIFGIDVLDASCWYSAIKHEMDGKKKKD